MKGLIIALLCLVPAAPAGAAGMEAYLAEEHPDMDPTAAEVLELLGSMSTWERLFADRLATLTPESQRDYAATLAMDGQITREDLQRLPVAVHLPGEPAGILPLLAERVRSDYWPGFYRRHTFAVNMKMHHWADTAERRYDDPAFCRELIRIFFLMRKGDYDGPMTLEYHPASADRHEALD